MVYNVLDFSAVADGKTLCTKAIQAAIDSCEKNGGGRVLIPAGNFYSGSIYLKSNVELHLEAGAVLTASADINDYNRDDAYPQNYGCKAEAWRAKHLIMALECDNVSITGFGTINGNGDSFRKPPEPAESLYVWMDGVSRVKDDEVMRPGQLICFVESSNVFVSGITVRNTPCWSLFFHGCEYVRVQGIAVFNGSTALNTDGIDIDCCRYVTVSDCNIKTGDDAIAIRTSGSRLKRQQPCEYVTINNCNLAASACGFRIGVGKGYIRHIRVSDITIERASCAIKYMTSYAGNGEAHIEDVHFSGVSVGFCSFPIVIQGDRASIKNVSVENMTASGIAGIRIDPDSNCEAEDGAHRELRCEISGVRLSNINYRVLKEERELTARHIASRGQEVLFVGDAQNVVLDSVNVSYEDGARQSWSSTAKILSPKQVKLIDCNLQ